MYAEEDTRRPTVCVIYPDTAPPARFVFLDILRGVESRLSPRRLCPFALPEPAEKSSLKQFLDASKPRVVVTLGRAATEAFERIEPSRPYVIGALDLSPQTRPSASGVSLSVDPQVVFERLKRIAPAVKRIFVVYDPSRDEWVITRAREVAASLGLELHAEAASDIVGSAPIYGRLIRSANSATDALWLTANSSLIGDVNLVGYLVEQSWLRRVIVFSNILEHARAGVLFSTYPDTEALGRRLGELAEEMERDPRKVPGIEPLHDIRLALNARVARHLGLLAGLELRQFDMVFGATETLP